VHTWTIRAAALAVLSAAALIGASVGSPAAQPPAGASEFGGPLAAHVVVRPIDRDLSSATGSLHRVTCAAASATRTCFAASR
jgi:hypothetical protein